MGYCTDEHLNVRGTKSLKVCDASSFGSQVDGNPTATLYAMAELLSDRLIKQYTNNKVSGKWRYEDTILIFENNKIMPRRKVAAFDLENTLISSNDINWIILKEFVVPTLNNLYKNGHKIIIFTNQHQLCQEYNNNLVKKWQEKIESVVLSLKVPVQIFVSTCPDQYSKLNSGLWRHFTWNFNEGVEMDYKSSFYVGDDSIFASSIPLKYYTPEQIFNKPNDSKISHFNIFQSVRINAPADDVWNIVGEFYSLHLWHPLIRSTIKLNTTGSIVRHLIFADENGQTLDIVEKLLTYDHYNREYRYKNIGGIWGNIQENYEGKLNVIEDNNGQASIVTWSGSFDALEDGSTEFYRKGLESLANFF